MAKPAKSGDTVKVHYTGKLHNGTVFDTSKKREPFKFKLGDANILVDFEKAIIGMLPGQTKTIQIAAANAFGPHLPELVSDVEKEHIPSHIVPEVGQRLEIHQPNGPTLLVTIVSITDSTVTLDANHPLAGKDLIFDIELLEIL